MHGDGFETLMRERGDALLRTASFLAGSPERGRDLLQEVLADSLARARHGTVVDHPEAYVRTALVRTSVSWRRRMTRRPETLLAALPERPARATYDPDERHFLWTLLGQLSPRQRAVLVLRYYEGQSEAEIAALLGCSGGSVKRHAHDALTRLRGRLLVEAVERAPDGA